MDLVSSISAPFLPPSLSFSSTHPSSHSSPFLRLVLQLHAVPPLLYLPSLDLFHLLPPCPPHSRLRLLRCSRSSQHALHSSQRDMSHCRMGRSEGLEASVRIWWVGGGRWECKEVLVSSTSFRFVSLCLSSLLSIDELIAWLDFVSLRSQIWHQSYHVHLTLLSCSQTSLPSSTRSQLSETFGEKTKVDASLVPSSLCFSLFSVMIRALSPNSQLPTASPAKSIPRQLTPAFSTLLLKRRFLNAPHAADLQTPRLPSSTMMTTLHVYYCSSVRRSTVDVPVVPKSQSDQRVADLNLMARTSCSKVQVILKANIRSGTLRCSTWPSISNRGGQEWRRKEERSCFGLFSLIGIIL